MNQEQKDSILNLFVSDDDLRPGMKAPWLWSGFTGATDGYVLVLFPGEDERFTKTDININSVIPKDNGDRNIISCRVILEKLKEVPLVSETIKISVKCDECDGTGRTECEECGQDRGCPECDEMGTIEKEIPGEKMVFDERCNISINGVAFAYKILSRLLKTCEILNVDECTWTGEARPLGVNEFHVGEIKILLMPIRLNEPNEADVEVSSPTRERKVKP